MIDMEMIDSQHFVSVINPGVWIDDQHFTVHINRQSRIAAPLGRGGETISVRSTGLHLAKQIKAQ